MLHCVRMVLGGAVPKLRNFGMAIVQQFSPHVIVLEIGSNNLGHPNVNCHHVV